MCKECGRELPLDSFGYQKKSNWYLAKCRECMNAYNRAKRAENSAAKALEIYLNDPSLYIKRKYKQIDAWRILDKEEHGFELKSAYEKFVKMLDYKETWCSTQGRVIIKNEDRTYQLLEGKYTGTVLYYTLEKNVYFKTRNEWSYRRCKVSAADLVVQTFIVNYDMKNNTKIWHSKNDKRDNYYKHLYPVTDKQYDAIAAVHKNKGAVTEEEIIQIVNASEYKPDDWNAKYMQRTVYGIGYHGGKLTKDDYDSGVLLRWNNMLMRCYSKIVHKDKPYYKNKKVCEEWKNFQNFKIWYEDHYVPGYKVDLDKDLICKESNTYSPENCSLVSHYINALFEDRGAKWCVEERKDGTFHAFMSVLNQKKKAGVFDTREEAEKAYLEFKQDYIIKMADSAKGKVPDYVYNAMIRFNVAKQCSDIL